MKRVIIVLALILSMLCLTACTEKPQYDEEGDRYSIQELSAVESKLSKQLNYGSVNYCHSTSSNMFINLEVADEADFGNAIIEANDAIAAILPGEEWYLSMHYRTDPDASSCLSWSRFEDDDNFGKLRDERSGELVSLTFDTPEDAIDYFS